MSAPYKRMEFTASSGNECRLKLFPPIKNRLVVNVTWDSDPSEIDIAECDRWFPAAAQALFPSERIAVAVSNRIDDADIRESVCAAVANPIPHPERN